MRGSFKIALGILGSLLTFYSVSCFDSNVNEKKDKSEIVSVHKPYEDKQCKDCHSKAKNYEWMSDFCLACHSGKWDEFSKDYKHRPAIENCTTCHDPHKSKFEYLLKKESKTLCLTCHESDLKDNRVHSKLDRACTECHNPHASEYELILKKGGHDVCLLCHTQEEYNQKKANKNYLTIKECKSCHEKESVAGRCCEKEE